MKEVEKQYALGANIKYKEGIESNCLHETRLKKIYDFIQIQNNQLS